MCTINLSFDDALVERARQLFDTNDAFSGWVHAQMENLLKQLSVDGDKTPNRKRKIVVCDEIMALSDVPAAKKDFDYKDELENVLSEKYS